MNYCIFIRKIKTPQGTPVESYREGKKVKQRTLLPLGLVGEGRLEKLILAIQNYNKDLIGIGQLLQTISVKDTYILGPLLILEKLFEKLNMDNTLKNISNKHKRISFDLRKIVFTLVANCFVEPGSKLKVFERWQNRFYPKMLEPDLKLCTLFRE